MSGRRTENTERRGRVAFGAPQGRQAQPRLVARGGSPRSSLFGGALAGVLALAWIVMVPLAVAADESPAAGPAHGGAAAEGTIEIPSNDPPRYPQGDQGPGLDSLLKLPSGFLDGGSRGVAGAGEDEWRRRFERAQNDLDAAAEVLAETKKEMDSAAEGGGSSTWSVAPPGGGGGGGPSASPLSFKLRQKLKEDREGLEAAERALRELRIEADLAGVPEDWRGDKRRARSRTISN